LRLAAITQAVCELTPEVTIENVEVVFPAGTVTEGGTVAATLPLESDTTVPVAPAGPLRVTVAVEGLPPSTDDGFRPIDVSVAGLTVRVAVCVVEFCVAVMSALVLTFTPVVVMLNVAVVLPAAMVTDAGTVDDGSPLESPISMPLGPAGPSSVRVPFELVPP
jgi:hypothetical protein